MKLRFFISNPIRRTVGIGPFRVGLFPKRKTKKRRKR